MASFGEDFDLDVFQVEFDSEEPEELNRVKALERGVDQLYTYMVELAAFGLELAGERSRFDETNARRDLDALARVGVISRGRARRLQRLREYRRLLVHEYASATAAEVHEAARILADELPPFYRAYGGWVRSGFGRVRITASLTSTSSAHSTPTQPGRASCKPATVLTPRAAATRC
jgi:uncharacterized protein YutE (UPF0331/DUF86 family)